MFGKRKEAAAVTSDIGEARESRERGALAQETVESRRGEVESLADQIRARRLKNGFGEDYQISLTPRWSRHA